MIVKGSPDKTQAVAQVLPGGFIEGSAAVSLNILFDKVGKVIMRPIAAAKSY